MTRSHGENYLPWTSSGKPLKVRTPEEIKMHILSTNSVKEVMAQLVRERSK
jgi:hypothetical protein